VAEIIKKKFAFYIPSLQGGGTERFLVNLLNGLGEGNSDLSLILEGTHGEYFNSLPKNINIVSLNTHRIFKIFFKLIKYLRNEKPDIIFCALPHVNIVSILAVIFSGSKTKIIISERSTFSRLASHSARKLSHKLIARFVFPLLMRALYPKADAIVCVSNGVADDLIKIVGNLRNIKVIYNPVARPDVIRLSKDSVEHEWFLDKKVPVILAVGRFTKAKDYPTLLRAFSIVQNETDARLVILGKGEEKEKILSLIKSLGIEKNTALLGFQENPYKYMSKATVFVLSSTLEGFPNVLVEAMACGAPVVATNCESGPCEIIINRESGILVPVGQEKELSEAINYILKNENFRKKISANGLARAEFFSFNKGIAEYKNLFNELLK